MSDMQERYWAKYTELQHVKHEILKRYLDGWYPIISKYETQILYIDTHAGRGRHETGQAGSPIIALESLLNHTWKDKILRNTKVYFLLFENNEQNALQLESEIDKYQTPADNLEIRIKHTDYEKSIESLMDTLSGQNKKLIPTFAFIDPFSFTLSVDFLNKFLQHNKCELLINLMFRFVDMSLRNEAQEENMNDLFGTSEWKDLRKIENVNERADKIIMLFSSKLCSKYVTHMRMCGKNNALKYVILHATNHIKGRELMKSVLWKIKPDGEFSAHERNNPNQIIMIHATPDLAPLEESLMKTFIGRSIRINEIYNWLASNSLFLEKHLHQVLKEKAKEEQITFSQYQGKFAFNKNPIVSFLK